MCAGGGGWGGEGSGAHHTQEVPLPPPHIIVAGFRLGRSCLQGFPGEEREGGRYRPPKTACSQSYKKRALNSDCSFLMTFFFEWVHSSPLLRSSAPASLVLSSFLPTWVLLKIEILLSLQVHDLFFHVGVQSQVLGGMTDSKNLERNFLLFARSFNYGLVIT